MLMQLLEAIMKECQNFLSPDFPLHTYVMEN